MNREGRFKTRRVSRSRVEEKIEKGHIHRPFANPNSKIPITDPPNPEANRLELQAFEELVGIRPDPGEGAVHTSVTAGGRGSGQFSALSGFGGSLLSWAHVAKSTTAGGEDWSLVFALESLALEFLIEAEDGSLGGWSNVSGTSTRREKVVVVGDGGSSGVDLSESGWGSLLRSSASVVTSTAAASVEDGLRWNAVDDLHFEDVVCEVRKFSSGGDGSCEAVQSIGIVVE